MDRVWGVKCVCVFIKVIKGKWALVCYLCYLYYFSRVISYFECFVIARKEKMKNRKMYKSKKLPKTNFYLFLFIFLHFC